MLPILAFWIYTWLQGSTFAQAKTKQVLHRELCPSIPPTPSSCLCIPKAPCTPAEMGSTNPGCLVPVLCVPAARCHTFPGTDSRPTPRHHFKPLLAEMKALLTNPMKLITPSVSLGNLDTLYTVDLTCFNISLSYQI